MYIERFSSQNKSFSRGSTPSANSNNLKQIKVNRLNNSLNKINLKSEKEDQILQELQNQLIGQYDHSDFPSQKKPIENNLRQLFISQNARGQSNPIQNQTKPPIDNVKVQREKQKLQQIYQSLHSKNDRNGRKNEQKFSGKKIENKKVAPIQETINSNLFKEKLTQLPLKNESLNLNGKIEKNYCFYDTSFYQNYIRNSPPEDEDQQESQSSSFYSQMGGVRDKKSEVNVEKIQTENIDNIRTITSSNNINKQDNTININPSFYNNKSKFVAMLQNKNNNQSFQPQIEKQQQRKLQPYSLQNTQEKSPERNQQIQLGRTSEVLQRSEQREQIPNIKNNSIMELDKCSQNPDPLSQIDELKQIMMIEQQNISKILNKGNRALQPKSANSSQKETKTSFYQKQDISISDINKEGLLGAYEEYNKMSKHEIIEKLLVSEHIMKQLYKKTKSLQEQMQQIRNQQQQQGQSDQN